LGRFFGDGCEGGGGWGGGGGDEYVCYEFLMRFDG
jgi:hypothetical protein